jgi:hypothetical protein
MRTYVILKFSKRSLRTWNILKVLTLIIYNCSTQLQFFNEKRLYMQQTTRPHFNISALGCFAHRIMCVTEFTATQWKEILTNLRFVGTISSLGCDLQNQSCMVIAMKEQGWEKCKLATECSKSLEVFHSKDTRWISTSFRPKEFISIQLWIISHHTTKVERPRSSDTLP